MYTIKRDTERPDFKSVQELMVLESTIITLRQSDEFDLLVTIVQKYPRFL